MKKNSTLLLMALTLVLPALSLRAQDNENDQPRPPQQRGPRYQQRDGDVPGVPGSPPSEGDQRPPQRQRQDGPPREESRQFGGGPRPGDGQRHTPPPLMGALDANNDGTLDKKEIAAAAKALRKLDKNNDGKLTMDELRPAGGGMRPQQGPGGSGPGGPGGFGGPGGRSESRSREGNFSPEGGPRPLRGDGPAREGFRPGGSPREEGQGAPRHEPPLREPPLRDDPK